MGLKQTGTTVGGSIAGAVLPVVGVMYGLGAAFIAAGILVLSGIVFVLTYRESDRIVASPRITMEFLNKGFSLSAKNHDLLWLGGVGFFYAAVQSIVVTYIALYAHSVLGFGPILAGLFLSIVNISGTVGRPVYGIISDQVFRGSRIKDFFLIAVTSFVMLLLLSWTHSGIGFWEIVPDNRSPGVWSVGMERRFPDSGRRVFRLGL